MIPNSPNNYDDEVMKSMQAQFPKSDTLNGKSMKDITERGHKQSISPDHLETIKLRELQD